MNMQICVWIFICGVSGDPQSGGRSIAEPEKRPGAVPEFDDALWGRPMEYVTVNKDKSMVFTPVGGTEMAAWDCEKQIDK